MRLTCLWCGEFQGFGAPLDDDRVYGVVCQKCIDKLNKDKNDKEKSNGD